MYLKSLELLGFKSFAEKRELLFTAPVTAIVGPNGSGKSNIAEAFRFVLGEQSMKSMRTKRGEDLIFNGSRMAGRKNRAMVTVSFDNTKKIFPVDYDEVSLSREVARDGTNRYLINGAQVRLKDVLELLASAKIGSSQHHIISQGEADRILKANPDQRREMIEDALGLRIYQFKITESVRKLRKTDENIERVVGLQKEVKPHLKFLEKQVQRIEEARALRGELTNEAKIYFKKEDEILRNEKALLDKEYGSEKEKLAALDGEIQALRSTLDSEGEGEHQGAVVTLEEETARVREEKEGLSRKLGRLEGMIHLEEKQVALDRKRREEGTLPKVFSYESVRGFFSRVEERIQNILTLDDLGTAKDEVRKVSGELHSFLEGSQEKEDFGPEKGSEGLEKLKEERRQIEVEVARLEKLNSEQRQKEAELRARMESERGEFRKSEREIFEKMTKRNEVQLSFSQIESKISGNTRRREDFESDLTEYSFLLGREVLRYQEVEAAEGGEEEGGSTEVTRKSQEETRRGLERKRVKVEEMGGSGEEVIAEYESLKEREEFLTREVEDLQKTKESLEDLISELEDKLDQEFKDGLREINKQFQEFFEVMFGGGKVSLGLEKKVKKAKKKLEDDTELPADGSDIDDEEEEKQKEKQKEKLGLEISVSLPKKRVKGVQMLSGGERSLTSIALMFAVSQVNPPPFLILDETDAALDEANSRRYGEMLERLSGMTQLIIITHNRETMARAGVLYGVTVGKDAISNILSVKLEDATQNAAR